MSDLINREAAIEAIEELTNRYFVRKAVLVMAQDAVNNLPSAQPEIIECKDCEHWYTEEDDQYGYCRNHDFWTSDIWFCADGDRRKA